MVLGIENLDYIKKKKCFFNYQTKDLFINEGVLLQILSIGHSREVPNCKISHTYFTYIKFEHLLYSLTLH